MTAPSAPPKKHDLLIVPAWKPGRGSAFLSLLRRLRLLPRDYPVQHEPFSFELRVTNIALTASPACTITDVTIGELGPGKLELLFPGPFTVRSLNPGEAGTISVGFFGTFLSGLVWVECKIAATDPGWLIQGRVRDRATGETTRGEEKGDHWADEWFIHRRTDVSTGRTNELLIVLTLITVVHDAIGLDTLLGLLKTAVHALFVWLSGLAG